MSSANFPDLDFDITGIDETTLLADAIFKDLEKKTQQSNKRSTLKAVDQIMYGRASGINEKTATADSFVGILASQLGVAKEQIYFRSFTAGIKTKFAYASGMIRTNSINGIDLLVPKSSLKNYYGYSSRKRKVKGSKANKQTRKGIHNNVKSLRMKGSFKIGKKTYARAFIADGTRRTSSKKMNTYYMEKLGANKFNLTKVGNPNFLFQRKSDQQPKPYPVKVIKIKSKEVTGKAMSASKAAIAVQLSKIDKLADKDLANTLKRFKRGYENVK